MSAELPTVNPDLSMLWDAGSVVCPEYPDWAIVAHNKPCEVWPVVAAAEQSLGQADRALHNAYIGDIMARKEREIAIHDERKFAQINAEVLGDKAETYAIPNDSTHSELVIAARNSYLRAKDTMESLQVRVRCLNAIRQKVARLAVIVACAPGAALGLGIVTAAAFIPRESVENVQEVPQPTPSAALPTLPGVTLELSPDNASIVITSRSPDHSAGFSNILDCKTTGSEAVAAETAAKNGLEAVAKLGGGLKKAEAIGVVDDTRPNAVDTAGLGAHESGKNCYARLLGDVGGEVLRESLANSGQKTDIRVRSEERVLSEGQIAQIDELANSLSMTRYELTSLYETNRDGLVKLIREDSRSMQLLDDLLFQGVEYRFVVPNTAAEPKSAPQPQADGFFDKLANAKVIGIGLKWLISFAAGIGFSAASAVLFRKRVQGRLAQRWARRQLQRFNAEKAV